MKPPHRGMSDSRSIIPYENGSDAALPALPNAPRSSIPVPPIVDAAGKAARFAWREFFEASLANRYTRKNYVYAVMRFLSWADKQGLQLLDIMPGDVGLYLGQLKAAPARSRKCSTASAEKPLATPTKKLHLAALRGFFDCLVHRHVIAINPAATARTERYAIIEGKTPHIPPRQAEQLLASIQTTMTIDAPASPGQPPERNVVPDLVGLRDKAVLSVLVYTAARVGAVAKLTLEDLRDDGTQYTLRFAEKGGKAREIPVRHDLERLLLAYIQAAGITEGPLFRTTKRKTGILTGKSMTAIDMCRMMKRRLKEAGLPTHYSPHSFRVTTITDLLEQKEVSLEEVQYLAGHADPRTTRLYDRSGRKVTRNLVERISIDLESNRKPEGLK
jgi:integrase/recombinase XerD